MTNRKAERLDAVLVGSIEWSRARTAAIDMLESLSGEVAQLQRLASTKDAYSPIAWLNICRQLRIVTDGMIAMRMLSEGKTTAQICTETGILPGSVKAYKAWNTMYQQSISRNIQRRIALRGRTEAQQKADAKFLRACGIALDLTPRDTTEAAS